MKRDVPFPNLVVRCRMDLDVSRPHPEEGYEEYPWVGDIVVQWEEFQHAEAVLHERVVWTGEPQWDAPGYSSEDAENRAMRAAASRLADLMSMLCDAVLPRQPSRIRLADRVTTRRGA